MTKKQKRERLMLIVERLCEIYPDAECALQYGGDPWRLLVMSRLSAQCTDARVNMVTPALFARFPDAKSFAVADTEEIEELIRSTGFYRNKAKNIKIDRKNNKISGVLADSNWRDFEDKFIYENIEDLYPKLNVIEDKIANLYYDIICGNIHTKKTNS